VGESWLHKIVFLKGTCTVDESWLMSLCVDRDLKI